MVIDIDEILDDILKKLDGWGNFEILDVREEGGNIIVELDVEGDWKHAHGYADSLFSNAGFELMETEEADDGEDDWYEAIHLYRYKEEV